MPEFIKLFILFLFYLFYIIIHKMSKYNVKDNGSLEQLNNHLTTNMWIGGQGPNAEDALVWDALNDEAPCVEKYPALAAWFYLVHYFRHVKDQWKVTETKTENKPAKKEEKPKEQKKTKDDDLDDMFAESKPKETNETKETKKEEDNLFEMDEEEDPEAAKARQERMRKALEAKKKKDATKGKKEEVIAKSLIILSVKAWEEDTDFDALAKRILSEITPEGLLWKTEYKTPVVAFNMKKLVMGCVVEDEKVSIDDVIEKIQAWEDVVQSVDIDSFDKI